MPAGRPLESRDGRATPRSAVPGVRRHRFRRTSTGIDAHPSTSERLLGFPDVRCSARPITIWTSSPSAPFIGSEGTDVSGYFAVCASSNSHPGPTYPLPGAALADWGPTSSSDGTGPGAVTPAVRWWSRGFTKEAARANTVDFIHRDRQPRHQRIVHRHRREITHRPCHLSHSLVVSPGRHRRCVPMSQRSGCPVPGTPG